MACCQPSRSGGLSIAGSPRKGLSSNRGSSRRHAARAQRESRRIEVETMIAGIYARKSTEQNGVADETRSVTRQIEHAKAYAERKGWTVDDAAVFVDDGVSGAEFANRPGFVRLMNALKV